MKNILYLFFLICFLFSCRSSTKKSDIKLIEENTALLNDLMKLWETGDTFITKNLFAKNCEYIDMANNRTLNGIDEANRYISHVHKWGTNIQMKVRKMNASKEMGYVEWTFMAVQSNPIEGRVPIATNKKINLNGVTIVEFKNGKILRASDYMDILGFVVQLGSRVELPGGVVIGE